MKRCYFIGLDWIYDSALHSRMYNELEKIIQDEEKLEFWFDNISTSFLSLSFFIVLRLRTKYPNKDIKIVHVYVPDENNYEYLEYIDKSLFPMCISDKNIYAKSDTEPRQWIIRNCDYVFTYNYPLLRNRSITKLIEYADRLSDITIIPFSFDETNQLIREKFEQLSERSKLIITMRDEGKKQREIAETIGVSTKKANDLIDETIIKLERLLKPVFFKKVTPSICALIGLVDKPNAIQLIAFQSLLKFLVDKCQVTEFWIDKKHWNDAYGASILSITHKGDFLKKAITAKVIICANDNKTYWKKEVNEYAPLYSRIITLKSNKDERSMYEEIIQKCDYLISDFTCEGTELIKELCADNGDISILNIACDNLRIDNQYPNTDTIEDQNNKISIESE